MAWTHTCSHIVKYIHTRLPGTPPEFCICYRGAGGLHQTRKKTGAIGRERSGGRGSGSSLHQICVHRRDLSLVLYGFKLKRPADVPSKRVAVECNAELLKNQYCTEPHTFN